MKKLIIITSVIIAILIGAFVLINWNARQNATAMLAELETEAVRRDSLSSVVGATGTVRSNQLANLVWKVSGRVDQVLPEVGDTVTAGETLATISETSLPAYIILAQADLVNYEKELETLLTSSIQQAEAFKAVEEAENTLQDALHPALAQAQALAAVAAAEADLDKAQTQHAILSKPVSQDAIDQAYSNKLLAENKLNKTLDSIEKLERERVRLGASPIPSKYKKEIAKGLNKGLEGLEFQRTQDQLAYDRAVNKYENLLEPPDPLDLAVAEAAVFAAQAQLDNAMLQYTRIKDGYSQADLAVLEAVLVDAQREYERVKDAPPSEDIAVLEAKIAASQAAIDQTEIVAPFSGTITSVDIQPGDQVSAGTLSFQLDDLSTLLVDLNVSEIDINLVEPGQNVVLTFDGILAKEYHGTVAEVAAVGTETQGVTTFRVTVELLDADEDVRPEMTSAVDIVTSEVDDVLLVPNRAIRLLDGERVIYILTETPEKLAEELSGNSEGPPVFRSGQSPLNAIVPIPVTLGATSALYSEILSGDLKEGDLVVLNPPADGITRTGGNAITVEIHP
ncbi:efflux RND transporter periplasmic adaptor subunit [Chloroflexota bacterium]